MAQRVRMTMSDGVADVRLHRPEKLNALDFETFEELVRVGRELRDDTSLRAVVLSGEGRSFCAGLDVSSFMAGPERLQHMFGKDAGDIANRAQMSCWVWTTLPVPVIAAIHGHCFGGGLQLALGADIRLVTADAELSIMEIKWGLVPDMTGVQRLRELVRIDVAKELTFTGQKITGSRAVEIGLATRVSTEPREEALALATEIASKSPDAICAGKQLFERSATLPIEQALDLEAKYQAQLIGSKNQLEAIQAQMQKRPPNFGPRTIDLE